MEVPGAVSILTRPEGRVQLHAELFQLGSNCFNPHPSRRTGATHGNLSLSETLSVSILTRPEGRVQPLKRMIAMRKVNGFNPHPSRRTGATLLPL